MSGVEGSSLSNSSPDSKCPIPEIWAKFITLEKENFVPGGRWALNRGNRSSEGVKWTQKWVQSFGGLSPCLFVLGIRTNEESIKVEQIG